MIGSDTDSLFSSLVQQSGTFDLQSSPSPSLASPTRPVVAPLLPDDDDGEIILFQAMHPAEPQESRRATAEATPLQWGSGSAFSNGAFGWTMPTIFNQYPLPLPFILIFKGMGGKARTPPWKASLA